MNWNPQWKSVIFDFDGTLLDSLAFWNHLDEVFLHQHGMEVPPGFSESIKQMTVPEAAAYYAEHFPMGMTAEEITAGIEELAASAYRDTLPLKDGARDFLEALHQKGIPAALATVTCEKLLVPSLERLDIRRYFRHLVTAEHFTGGKRSPEIYLHAAKLLGTAPEETLVIEDALHAAKTAKSAGFPVLGILDPNEQNDWPALRQTADAVIAAWQEAV